MSRTYDALLKVERLRKAREASQNEERPYRVVTVASSKGGVGKTTFALNLAVYLRALREDLPVLVISLDEQATLDRMFGLPSSEADGSTAAGLRVGSFASAVQLGQYGVHYVPTSTRMSDLKLEVRTLSQLDQALRRTRFQGLVILDTKGDLEILTQNAVAASDLTVVVVKDLASLHEADRLFALTDEWGRPRSRMRVLLSLIDLRVKYEKGHPDVLALLLAGLRERSYASFPTFLARSPTVEALNTNPDDRPVSILHGSPRSVVHRQMRALTGEVLTELERQPPAEPVAALDGMAPRAKPGVAPAPRVPPPRPRAPELEPQREPGSPVRATGRRLTLRSLLGRRST